MKEVKSSIQFSRPAVVASLLALFGVAGRLCGHDFWIEPSSFRPAVGSELSVFLRGGMDFQGEPVPRNPRLIERFFLLGSGGEEPIDGFPAADPAGLVTLRRPGLHWIGYRSGRTPLNQEAAKFEKYLVEEGLEKIHAAREKRGETGREGREVFSRSVKSLIAVGGQGGEGFDRPLGLTLEIVPERDPRRTRPGASLPVRLLFEGKPLEGALVVAMRQDRPEEKVRARTDGKGRVSLKLPAGGVWLVKAVQMVPAPPETGADWESIWTSLTFEMEK